MGKKRRNSVGSWREMERLVVGSITLRGSVTRMVVVVVVVVVMMALAVEMTVMIIVVIITMKIVINSLKLIY
jgi:hypothetical protein